MVLSTLLEASGLAQETFVRSLAVETQSFVLEECWLVQAALKLHVKVPGHGDRCKRKQQEPILRAERLLCLSHVTLAEATFRNIHFRQGRGRDVLSGGHALIKAGDVLPP